MREAHREPQGPGSDSADDQLVALLRAAASVDTIPDRRVQLLARIEDRRRRASRARFAVAAATAVVIAGAVVSLVSRPPQESSVLSGSGEPGRLERVERTIPPGLPLVVEANGQELAVRLGGISARASMTAEPLPPYEAFGVVPVGAGAVVTGATQSRTRDSLTPVVVVVVSAPRDVARVRLVEEDTGHEDVVEMRSGIAVLAVSPDENNPQLQIRIEVFNANGELIGSQRFLPFSQEPWTCDTNTKMASLDHSPTTVSPNDANAAPDYQGPLFAAPLPAACE